MTPEAEALGGKEEEPQHREEEGTTDHVEDPSGARTAVPRARCACPVSLSRAHAPSSTPRPGLAAHRSHTPPWPLDSYVFLSDDVRATSS